MQFDVEDKGLLKGIKVNDKVSFEFYATDDGRHVVTKITILK
jgi:Cu/Ag efflux protein CusF